MPRKVTAYGCEFKCGQSVVIRKQSIVDHEKNCFSNPKVRACKTCRIFSIEDNDGHCEEDKIPENKFAVRGCEYWKPEK